MALVSPVQGQLPQDVVPCSGCSLQDAHTAGLSEDGISIAHPTPKEHSETVEAEGQFGQSKTDDITSLQPESGTPGTQVRIYGTGFDPAPSENTVTFGGVKTAVDSVSSDTSALYVQVPSGVSGRVRVKVKVAGETTESSDRFTIITGGHDNFDTVGVGLTGVNSSSSAWGDFDSDGDLDLVVTGSAIDNRGLSTRTAKIYKNEGGGAFSPVGAGLSGVRSGSLEWGDYDGDSDPDLIITGIDAGRKEARIYENEGGGSFSAIGAVLIGVRSSSTAWGDYDSDGDLDLIVTGSDNNIEETATIYENEGGGSFSAVGAGLTSVEGGSSDWGDFDSDGDLDLVVTGNDSNEEPTATIYKNEGGGSFSAVGAGLTNVDFGSSSAWGDFDSDGDLDLVVTGSDINSEPTATIFENKGGGTFEPLEAGLVGVDLSSSDWGDFDGDGDLDLVVTGEDANGTPTAKIYENEGGGSFSAIGAGLTGVDGGSSSWGDFDSDGDLDLVVTGFASTGRTATIYENKENQPPAASFTFAPSIPDAGETVSFDAGGSEDPDGTLQFYKWDFGDGSSGSGAASSHTYGEEGTYAATLTVTDQAGATSDTTVELSVRPAQVQASATKSFGGNQKEDYQLVALPGEPTVTLSETASGDWQGFRERGANGGDQPFDRSECSGGCRFGPGSGFWLIAEEAWQVTGEMEAVTLRKDGTARVDIQNGWNVVSNPMETDVSWSAVQETSGTSQPLWQWSGSWDRASTFESATSGEAYYFRDDRIGELAVPFPGSASARQTALGAAPQAALQTTPQAKSGVDGDGTDSENKALVLSVTDGEGQAVTTVKAGTRSGAKSGLDRHDQYGPPGYFSAVVLRLVGDKEGHPDIGRPTEGHSTLLAGEYRKPHGEGQSFTLHVQAPADTVLTLHAETTGSFDGEKIALVEEATGQAYDLRKKPTATVITRPGGDSYRLLIGSAAYVEEKAEEVRPSQVELLPNYPNPFSRQTTIEYTLPEPSEVHLTVHDMLGRRVATLVNGRREEGFHRVQWSGKKNSGSPVASGVYFGHLKTKSGSETQKMVVVR